MDEHTTERGAKPMADPVYGIGFIDDDATRTELHMRAAHHAMDNTLRKFPGAKWREKPQVERVGDKVTIRARLVV